MATTCLSSAVGTIKAMPNFKAPWLNKQLASASWAAVISVTREQAMADFKAQWISVPRAI